MRVCSMVGNLGPQNTVLVASGIDRKRTSGSWGLRFWNDVVLWIRARRILQLNLKYMMVPVNNSKPSFSSSVFICITILIHAWPLFLNLRDLQRSLNFGLVKTCTLEAWSVQFSDRFPGFTDSRPDFQSCFWLWDSGLSRNLMIY